MLDKTIKLEYNIDIDEKKGCFCIENDLDYIIIYQSVNFVFFYIRNTVGGIN